MPVDDNLLFSPVEMSLVSAIVTHRSISAAAAAVGMSQPTASQRLGQIEVTLGRRLFDRVAGGVRPNRNAEAYLVFAEAMKRVGEDARRFFSASAGEPVLRLGVNEDVSRTILPDVLALFSRLNPNFSYRVYSDLSTPLFEMLDKGKLDIVLGKQPGIRTGGHFIRRISFSWYQAAGIDLTTAGPVHVVTYPTPSETRDVILRALSNAGRDVRVVFEASSLTAIEAAVRAGLGLSAFDTMTRLDGLISPSKGVMPAIDDVDLVLEVQHDASASVRAFGAVVEQVVKVMQPPG